VLKSKVQSQVKLDFRTADYGLRPTLDQGLWTLNFLWIDGRIVPAKQASVSALDPAVQIGFGLFEVTRAYDGVPFLLDRHLARMRRSARHFGLRLRWTDATVERGARALLKSAGLKNAYVRLVLTGGGVVMIQAKPLPAIPPQWYRKGAAVDFAPWRRDARAPLFGHKTLNYLENVLTRERARAKGLADVLFLSTEGRVLEGTVSNVFLVKNGRLRTPKLEGVLPGVTRDVVIRLARTLKIRVEESHLTPRDFARADEAFLTNALVEVLPVSRGPVTSLLSEAYKRLVAGHG
jgi:branched-subunit amino acid aminotransferase/4-amino-4-deoxychorismate lyase